MTQFQPQQRDHHAPIGRTQITWQILLMVLLGIALLVFGSGTLLSLLGVQGHQTPKEVAFWKGWGLLITLGLGAAMAALGYSQWRRGGKADLAPDLLAMVFDAGYIYQTGPVHLVVLGTHCGAFVRVLALAQNRYDKAAEFRLHAGKNNRHLVCEPVPPSALILARIDIPAAAGLYKDRFRMQLFPTAGGGGGKLMRYASRLVPTTAEHEMFMTLVTLAAGHIHIPLSGLRAQPQEELEIFSLNSKSVLEMPLAGDVAANAGLSIDSLIGRLPVKTQVLWQPGQPVDQARFAQQFLDALQHESHAAD